MRWVLSLENGGQVLGVEAFAKDSTVAFAAALLLFLIPSDRKMRMADQFHYSRGMMLRKFHGVSLY